MGSNPPLGNKKGTAKGDVSECRQTPVLRQAELGFVDTLSPAVLKTAGLSKRIRREVIFEDISLSVPKGKVTAITGQNGAGKTTLAQILCGLTRQTR